MELTGVLNLLLVTGFCRGVIFQCTVSMLTFFLQQNVHLTEEASFYTYGLYGLVLPVMLFMSARPIDRLPSFYLIIGATTFSILIRIILLLIQTHTWISILLMAIAMAVADGLSSVGTTLAMKRIIYALYSGSATTQEKKLDLYMTIDYGLSNLGAAMASLCYVGLRHLFEHSLANSMFIVLALVMYIMALVLALVGLFFVGTADQALQNPSESHCVQSCCSRYFWIFMIVCSLLIPARTLFKHLDLVVPVYLTRTLGANVDFPYIQAINPMVTVIGVSLLACARYWRPSTVFLCRGSKYWAIVTGTFLGAIGFICTGLILLDRNFDPMLATGIGILIFSVGEVYWSPIFTAYALGQAPEGQEATYTALAALPSLASKFPTSLLSNGLLRHYCPPEGTFCDGSRLWVIMGSIAFITPLILGLSARWLNRRKPEKQRYN